VPYFAERQWGTVREDYNPNAKLGLSLIELYWLLVESDELGLRDLIRCGLKAFRRGFRGLRG
jgi:hypothetical protein